MMRNKVWTGVMTHRLTVRFDEPARGGNRAFSGEAMVYEFKPDDPKCKVNYCALIVGVPVADLCANGGGIGEAILKAAGVDRRAKCSGVNGTYDEFPHPFDTSSADRLHARDGDQSLVFYKK